VVERRRWSRRQVVWSARLLIGEGKVIAAKAMDASLHGLRIALDDGAHASTMIRHGESCAIEVHVPDSEARFFRQGEVRHFGEHGVGLAIAEPLPAALVPSLGEAVRDTPAASPKARGGNTASVMLRLRWLASALLRR
jgi:hypothetical protein